MLGAWDVQQLLDRKYKIQEQEANIKQQEATSAGLLRAAQGRGLDVTTGLAPGLAKAEIDERGASALVNRTNAGLAPGLAASTIGRNTSQNLTDAAGIRLTNATVGRVGAETRAISDLAPNALRTFQSGLLAVPTPTAASLEPAPTAPRKRPKLLQDTLREGMGFGRGMPGF